MEKYPEDQTQITTREGKQLHGIPEPENIDARLELQKMRDAAIAHALAAGVPFSKIEHIYNMTEQELRDYCARPDHNVI